MGIIILDKRLAILHALDHTIQKKLYTIFSKLNIYIILSKINKNKMVVQKMNDWVGGEGVDVNVNAYMGGLFWVL